MYLETTFKRKTKLLFFKKKIEQSLCSVAFSVDHDAVAWY